MCALKILDIKIVYINFIIQINAISRKYIFKNLLLYPECVMTMKGTPYRTVTSGYEWHRFIYYYHNKLKGYFLIVRLYKQLI